MQRKSYSGFEFAALSTIANLLAKNGLTLEDVAYAVGSDVPTAPKQERKSAPKQERKSAPKQERKSAPKQERKSARRYEDSLEATAKDAYAEILEKDVVKSSLEVLYNLNIRTLVVSRGVKGMGAFVKRLEKMGLIDAADRIDLTNAKTLNVLARTRGIKSWLHDEKLAPEIDGERTPVYVDLEDAVKYDFSELRDKRQKRMARELKADERREKKERAAAKKAAIQAQKRMKELVKDANTCLYVEQILKANKASTLVITA